MIKNIIFDIGKVLKGWHPDMERFFEAPVSEKVFHAIWGCGWWDEMDRGVIEEEELFRRMVAEAPDCEEQIWFIFDHLALISERYDYAIPWVKELKNQGYQVYFLSNYSRRLRSQVPQTIDFIGNLARIPHPTMCFNL